MTTHVPTDTAANQSDRVWHFIAYYGMSEVAQRATRLVTTVMLARLLTPVDLGVAAMAITCFELLRVIANAGIGQAVIRANDKDLAGTCKAAYRAVWLLCVGLAVAQTLVGFGAAAWVGRPQLAAMIACLAGVYLLMPMALIETYLLLRRDQHRTIASVAATQAVADNVLTIAFALAGLGAWAIVLPKFLTCPIWVVCMRRAQTWVRDPAAKVVPMRDIVRYSVPLVGAELLTAARLQLDKVLVGAMLGVEALGVYYFVFNGGIGLSLSLTSALSSSLFPYFASVAGQPQILRERLDRSLMRKALPIAGVVLLQAAMAPIYVPLLFGRKWTESAWMVAVLCASASTKLLADASSQAIRASGATRFELGGTLAVTIASLTALTMGLSQGLAQGVVVFSVVSAIAQFVFAMLARRRIVHDAHVAALEPLGVLR